MTVRVPLVPSQLTSPDEVLPRLRKALLIAQRSRGQELVNLDRQGQLFGRLKAAVPGGEWLQHLRDLGVKPRKAQRAMQWHRLCLHHPKLLLCRELWSWFKDCMGVLEKELDRFREEDGAAFEAVWG